METLKKIWTWLKIWAITTAKLFDRNSLLHVVCSALLVMAFSVIFPQFIAAVITLLIGVSKEVVWDKKLCRGVYDINDIIFDVFGIIVGLSLMAFLGL